MSHSDTELPETPVASSPTLDIRQAVAEDLQRIIDLDAETSSVSKPDYWQEIFSQYVTGSESQRYLLVADLGGETVGFALGEVRAWEFGSPPCGWVFGLGVTAEVREHRVGSALVQEMFAHFRRDGVSSVRTNVSRRDTLNLSFFRSLGMTAGPYVQLEYSLDDDDVNPGE
jgi:ribosomal protein S18 acetylase RimI-like enzyme